MILENVVSASQYAIEFPILFQTILYIEAMFLLNGIPAMYIFSFLLFKTKYYSKNSTRLMMHICLSFPFYAIPELYCIVLQIVNRAFLGTLGNDFWFIMANGCRTYYIMLGCLVMPGCAIERFFATRYVHDYEQKPRIYISTIIIIITNICCVILTLGRVFKWATYLPYLLIVGSTNLFAIITFIICHRKNLRYYRARFPKSTSTSSYSLSLRYQIIENIRCEMMQKRLFNAAFGFSVTLGILFAIAYLVKMSLITNICYQLFDLIIAVYATIVPIIGLFDERIMTQMRSMRLRKQKILSTPSSTTVLPTKEIKTVFGVEVVKSSEDVTQTYFTQLAQTWG